MKKLAIAIATIGLGLSLQAQSTNTAWNYWTVGAAPITTNVTLGGQSIPLTANGSAGLTWWVKRMNDYFSLQTTNKLGWKDCIGYCVFTQCEILGQQAAADALQQADAKASVQKIKAALNGGNVSDSTLQQILALLGL